MKYDTLVTIVFEGIKISSTFFKTLNNCFEKHGYGLPDDAIIVPPLDSLNECVAWKDIVNAFSKGKTLRAQFNAPPEHKIDVSIQNDMEQMCYRLFLDAHALAYGQCYTEQQKEEALRLQAVSLELHHAFRAYDTVAMSHNEKNANPDRKEPWFRFSKDAWKPIGELTMCPEEEEENQC